MGSITIACCAPWRHVCSEYLPLFRVDAGRIIAQIDVHGLCKATEPSQRDVIQHPRPFIYSPLCFFLRESPASKMDPHREDAIHHERFVKIICVGAGLSGLCLAYKLQRSFSNYSLKVWLVWHLALCIQCLLQTKIYEKNPQVGGTWYENRYPGCACDVPSHNYTYSFEPKADYTSVFASSNEIKGYLSGFADKYSLNKHIQTSHKVTETSWDQLKGRWGVTAIDLTTGSAVHDWCHILIHATGYLNKPAFPSVPGLETFRGPKLHSADWDENISIEGKNVLLIGSGASSVQILPAIRSAVKSAKVFIRTPRWTLPSPSSNKGDRFSPEDMARFHTEPKAVLNIRLDNERTLNSFFSKIPKWCQY